MPPEAPEPIQDDMVTREPDLLVVDQLRNILSAVDTLGTDLNSHRLARYEVAAACDLVRDYLATGRREHWERARTHLRRSVSVLPLGERGALKPLVDVFVESTLRLGPSERATALDQISHHPSKLVHHMVVDSAPRRHGLAIHSPLESAADVALIVRILRSIPRGLQRWVWQVGPSGDKARRSWDIETEAHVQSILWLALAPMFADLRYEESLSSIGRRRPRADFVLPERGIVLEAKFVRNGRDFSKVVEEVSADVGLYFGGGTMYQYLVVFVWDNSRSSELHEELLGAFRKVGVTEAVVVGRPGLMEGAPT